MNSNNYEREDEVIVLDREDEQTEEPSRYSVVLLNDDFTPMDWVIHILETLFSKTPDEAGRIMMMVHQQGEGVAQSGLSLDIAETKASMVVNLSQANEHPLQAVTREE